MAELRKVQPGDPLRIPARAYNLFIDAALAHEQGRRLASGSLGSQLPQSTIIKVRNGSGAARGRFEILGLGAPIIGPSDNQAEFQNNFAFEGATPDIDLHLGKFCILLESLPSNAIGRAVIAGVCPCIVDIVDTSHQWADITDDEEGYLTSRMAGSAHILWADSGTGQQDAIVLLGTPGSTGEAIKIATRVESPLSLSGDLLVGLDVDGVPVWDDNGGSHYEVVDAGNGYAALTDVFPVIGHHGGTYIVASVYSRLVDMST